ncbi:ADP-forming succinate--CoA ligase subunit beta [Thiorhodospira sibirica]|uniref:ADP-forming succinate--CoA ligase subunit beta n=1 Tax=Thiorhodospira sibirica TaxID=154347 RepID=UPI00022C1743|nr:ADP-forming succinate--CoA ligase subunit beta [Thiorhodospira sibirica]
MNLHEYQAKALLRDYGIALPPAVAVRSLDELPQACAQLGGDQWVAKAQIYAGSRGKAGGIRVAKGTAELREVVEAMLGSQLVTPQTGPEGLPVHTVLLETPVAIARELYVGLLVDRSHGRITLVVSDAGGTDIEEVAAQTPERIITLFLDPIAGLMPYQARRAAFGLNLQGAQINALVTLLTQLYRLFLAVDATLIEINPLVVDADGTLMALDAKITLDDNALYRQTALAALRDVSQEDEREVKAREQALNYIHLGGNIGCMVNGAGLAMATMDLIKLHGGEPANFLDVGGGTTAERVTYAFKLILEDPAVRAVFVNIFGGIVRCDLIAEGIIQAVREVGVKVPVVVRLEGTNVDQGRELLQASGLNIITASDLTDGAQKAVTAAQGGL